MKGLILNRNKYIKERGVVNPRCRALAVIVMVASVVLAGVSIAANHKQNSPDEFSYATGNVRRVGVDNGGDGKEELLASIAIIKSDVPEKHQVTKVVDGDTIYVADIATRIRLIGIDTPETVSPSKPVGCYGPEASNYLRNLILGKYVGLESDAASGDVDRYGRPLRYVYLDGENVNQKILLGGYGKEASYGSNYKYQSEFVASEKYAAQNNFGLWSPATCNGG